MQDSSSNVIESDVAGEGNTFSDNSVNRIVVIDGAANGLTWGSLISGNTAQTTGVAPGGQQRPEQGCS